jgi:hypothetical protein
MRVAKREARILSMSGRSCVGSIYRDEVNRMDLLYGECVRTHSIEPTFGKSSIVAFSLLFCSV